MRKKAKKTLAVVLSLCMMLGTVQLPVFGSHAAEYVKTPNRELFNSGMDGSTAYRIPAIVTSKKTGTVIASIDRRWNGWNDIGVIDSVIRRSEDNGATWSEVIPVMALNGSYAYTVDPALLVDNDETSEHYGRIYLLADMFQQGTGFGGAQAGTGYVEVDGKKYLKLTNAEGEQFTLRENGVVYDSRNQATNYQVETEAAAPYVQQGDLYKDGVKIGNIYRNSELTFFNTCYLWLTYSDDDGMTWSTPRDLTPEVKSEWMKFCGTGPGMGIKTSKGRLIFPTYCTNAAGKQSSFHIYSEDNGETWHQGGSPNNGGNMEQATGELTESCIVELDNGHLMQFMRSYNGWVTTSVSTDQGATWDTPKTNAGVKEPYCQMAAVHYPGKLLDPRDNTEKEAIIFSNPSPEGAYVHSPKGREYGQVRIAFVNADDTLDWAYKKVIEEKRYVYSSLTVMQDGNIGLVYEHENYAEIGAAFTSFSTQYIMSDKEHENTPAPTAISASVNGTQVQQAAALRAGDEVKIQVTFSQNVTVSGNVTLNVKVGDEKKEAGFVRSVSEDTLEFAYTVGASDAGNVTATGEVNVKDGAVAETANHVSLIDNPCVTKELTVGEIAEHSSFAILPTEGMSATAGSAAGDGAASNVLNDDTASIWHSKYPDDNGVREKHYLTIALGGSRMVSGLTYLPRQTGSNGTITEYQVEVSTNGTDFTPVARGEWLKNANEKRANFGGAVLATHVRLRALDTRDDFASAAAIRIIGTEDLTAAKDQTALLKAVTEAKSLTANADLKESAPEVFEAIEKAKKISGNGQASDAQIQEAADQVKAALNALAQTAKAELPIMLENEKKRDQTDFNLSSWSAYSAALAAAKEITSASSDAAAITAYVNLLQAEQMLAEKKDAAEKKKEIKEALAAMTSKVEAGQGNYTDETWNAYCSAVDALQKAADAMQSLDTLNALAAEVYAKEKALANKPDETEQPIETEKPVETEKPIETEKPPVPVLEKGKVYQTADGMKYKVTDAKKKTVSLVGTAKKGKITSLNVKTGVVLLGEKCKVTEIGNKAFSGCKKLKKAVISSNVTAIGKQAFANCKKLKTITVKAKGISKVGANAFKGIDKKAVIKVPKAKKAKYKKLFAKKGQAKTVRIK